MNKISVFEHPEFGRIRTLEIDGKIWFCASDVASALGYSNPRDAVVRHCKPMGVVVYDTPTRSAVQKIKYISEGNVYRLIAGSKLPSAEKFESWIFDELVPETLKNGGYLLGKKGETDNELLARAVLLAQKRIKERDSRISALEKENNYAILKLKLQAPKVQYYDKVLQSQSTYTTTQIAKELGMTAGTSGSDGQASSSANPASGYSKLLTRIKAIRQPGPMYGKAVQEKPERLC